MAANQKKPFSKYLSKIAPFSSEFLFTPQAAELVLILILFLALSYKNDLSTFSESPLGKTCLLILLFYSFFIHPKLGFVLSILAIAYYYSDLVGTLYRETVTNTTVTNHSQPLNESYTSQGFYSNKLINDNLKGSPFEGKFIGKLTSPDGSNVIKISTDVCGNFIQFNQKFEGNFIFNSDYGITYDGSNNISKLTNIDTSFCYIEGDVLGYRQYNTENNLQNYNKTIATIQGNVRYYYTINVNDPTKYDKIWLHMNYEDCKSVMTISDNRNANIPAIKKSAFTVREIEGFTFGDTRYKTPSVTFISSSPPPPPPPPEPETETQTETPTTITETPTTETLTTQEASTIQKNSTIFIDLTGFRSIGYLNETGNMIVNNQVPIEMSNFELKTFVITIADSKYNIDASNSILTLVSNTGLRTLDKPFNATLTVDISGNTEFTSNPNSDGVFVSGTIQGNVTTKNIHVDENTGTQTIQLTFLDGEIVNPKVSTTPPPPPPPPNPSNESFKDMETSVIVDAYPFTKDQVTIPSKFYTQYSYQLPATATATATASASASTSFSDYFKDLITKTITTASTTPSTTASKESFTDYQTSSPIRKTLSPQTKNDILLNNQHPTQQENQHHFRKSYCVNNQLLYKNTPVRSEMAEHIFPNLQINGLAGSNGMKCNPCDPTCPITFSNLDQRLENENIIQKRTRQPSSSSKYKEHNEHKEHNEPNQPNWASKHYDVFLPNPNNHPEFNNQIAYSKSSYLIPANARITPMNTPQ